MSYEPVLEAMREHGTQSIEWRRAYRHYYRSLQKRIDYLPDRPALKVLEQAIAAGWALSYSDAINQALRDWLEDLPE